MLTLPAKPLIYLDTHANPRPYQNPLIGLIDGKDQVEISRAGLELEKVIVYLNAITGGASSSLPTLVALSLPDKLLALLWIAHALFSERFFHSEDHLRFLDHDARMLLRGMTQLSLKYWQEELIETISFPTAASRALFPLGHPQPEKLYRQHPLREKSNVYYPVNLFYSLLREEREQELIQLLSALGANKITIQKQANSGALESDRVFTFPGKRWSTNSGFDSTQYPWLAYEPTWQTLAYTRIYQGCFSASLELTLDIASALSEQIDRIENLAAEYKSINTDNLSALRSRVLQPHLLWVTFPPDV